MAEMAASVASICSVNDAWRRTEATEPLLLLAERVAGLRIVLPWESLLRAVLQGERRFALAVAGSL
jgi:hypothetical protein